jgi:hypothetical protein
VTEKIADGGPGLRRRPRGRCQVRLSPDELVEVIPERPR